MDKTGLLKCEEHAFGEGGICGVVHRTFVPQGQSVNQHLYIETSQHWQESVQQKRPEYWNLGGWFLHCDNAFTHSDLLMLQFLAMNIIVIQHLPYLQDFSAAVLLYFPKPKMLLRGRRFEDVIIMQENLTVHLMVCFECGTIFV
jgi:hypothetical protein